MADGKANEAATIHMATAIAIVNGFDEIRLRIGFDMAQYLSALKAVNVKTDTPIEISLVHSLNLQIATPYGHVSNVYIVEVNGTQVIMTNRSPKARLIMYVFGTFRMFRCRANIRISVPFPSTPTMKIKANTIGTRYVSIR